MSRQVNIGISLLKIWACFSVVTLHFGGIGWGRRCSVPAFMFISLYLTAGRIRSGTISDVFKRIQRLYVPFVFWGAMVFVSAFMADVPIHFANVVWQFVTGYGYPASGQLYYIVILAVSILLILLVSRCYRFADLALLAITIGCVIMQYSGLNFAWFNDAHPNAVYTVGRVAEFLPLAILGYLFFVYKQFVKNILTFGLIAFGMSLLMWFTNIPGQPPGFAYQGLAPLIMTASICVVGISIGDRTNLKDSWCLEFIKTVGNTTGGIYFMHVFAGSCFVRYFRMESNNVNAFLLFFFCGGVTWILQQSRFTKWMVNGCDLHFAVVYDKLAKVLIKKRELAR